LAERDPEKAKRLQIILIGGASRNSIPAFKMYSEVIETGAKTINYKFASCNICT
jgi:hypothetical protein